MWPFAAGSCCSGTAAGSSPSTAGPHTPAASSLVFHAVAGPAPRLATRAALAALGFPLPDAHDLAPPAAQAATRLPPQHVGAQAARSDTASQRVAQEFHLLYLFVGAVRHSSVASFLRQELAYRNQDAATVFTDVRAVELDIGRDARGDLQNGDLQVHILSEVASANFHGVILSPPCGTWSRPRASMGPGPSSGPAQGICLGLPWPDGGQGAGV